MTGGRDPRVLVVDDDPELCAMLMQGLGSRGLACEVASSAEAAIERVASHHVDVIVTDLHMHGMSGLELSKRVAREHPEIPVLVMTAFGSIDTAVEAVKAGAHDFIAKPFDLDELYLRVGKALELRALRDEVRRLRETGTTNDSELLGESPAIARLRDMVRRVAESDASVLVYGETGSGKELVARAIHRLGSRANGPFVAVNCGALPEALLESELFGHVRGAFTDAVQNRKGLFMEANGGVMFLDEIGEMPLTIQVKLLRTLQERRVRPVGGDTERSFDVRIVSATHRDLETAVVEGRFREDLYYRLNVLGVDVPPLRSRGTDVLLLAHHFAASIAARAGRGDVSLSPQAAKALLAYPFPGNVRELANAMERAIALTGGSVIDATDLPDRIVSYEPRFVVVAPEDPEALLSLAEVEKSYILRVLEAVDGNKTRASQILGLDRKTLGTKLKTWGRESSS